MAPALRIFSICTALLGVAVALHAQTGPAVPLAQRTAPVTIDGVLDEPIWAEAAVLDGFQQFQPVDGRPAEDATEIRVWYGLTTIYFGIRAGAPQGHVRATLADRDKIEGDDYVYLLLDTFDDQRQAYLIGVNPLGVQADGVLRDATSQGRDTEAYVIDLNPDYVFASKGRVTAEGYEVEVAVPFKSLRYQAARTQQWGFNAIRRVQATGYEDTWAPVSQGQASFLAQSGRLTGLTNLRRGLVLDLNPEVTAGVEGEPEAIGGRWRYTGGEPSVGGNLRWGITNNLTLNATLNPDFSQVEADAAQIQFDPRASIWFPEKRPFFLDGIELFQMPNTHIYTRRIADPVGAVKLTGKVAGTTVAALSAIDDPSTSFADHHRWFNVVRLRRDLGGQSTLGVGYTDLVDGDRYNRVLALDGRFVWARLYDIRVQGATSTTRLGGERLTAPLWDLNVTRAGRHFGFNYSMQGIHPDFRAQSGFLRRVGIVHANFTPRYTWFGEEGSRFESWTASVSFDGTWDYDRFTDGQEPNDAKLHFNGSTRLRGGWRLSSSFLVESFKYPPALYEQYFVERTDATGAVVDTVAYTGTDRLSNYDLVVSVTTPRFQTFSASGFFVVGRDENFFEWAPANIFIATFSADWRPTEQLRFSLVYNHQQYNRANDGSVVGLRRVPRLKVEYQLTRALFVRVVGQYDASRQDDLRDNHRTEDPILLYDPETDTYERAVASSRNYLRLDALFSYRPTPGTVLFLGYGTGLDDERAFRFQRLTRQHDGFFFKLSYLFRV